MKGETGINPPKTPQSNRTVAVPRFLLALISDYADRLVDYEPQDRLFYFTKHYLRHELGCSPLLVSEWLGHEKIQTTLQTYAHLYPDKQGEVVSRLETDESENYSAVLSYFEKKLKTCSKVLRSA